MNYKSTRDISVNVKSAVAIAKGLSPDGGLFVPESLPVISTDTFFDLHLFIQCFAYRANSIK